MDRLHLLALALALAGCSGGASGGDDSPCTPEEHACGSLPGGLVNCVRNDSVLGCGTRCDPCPVPANGGATCVAGACGAACLAGHHRCGDGCVDDRAVESCGARCSPCPAPTHAHAVAACLAGACDSACLPGFDPCTTGCCAAPVAGITGPASLAAGVRHSCGVADGAVKCWGQNDQGQVGSGSADAAVLSPATVPGSAAFRQVAGGYAHTCAVDLVGDVWCWGSGQRAPVAVPGLHGVAWVAAGAGWSCALLEGGTAECWSGAASGARTPVPGLSGAVAIAAGWGFGCAVIGAGSLSCWGDNGRGQLGNPAAAASEPVPVEATNLDGISVLRAVALGQEHACAAYDAPGVEGAVRCWGRGSEGQLGHGAAPGIQRTAVEVVDASLEPLSGVVGIAAGSWHSCAVTRAGEVWCWGGSAARSTAAPVGGLGPAAAIVSGESHACALVVGGGGPLAPWCWGSNHLGQLGDGTRDSRDAPGPVVAF